MKRRKTRNENAKKLDNLTILFRGLELLGHLVDAAQLLDLVYALGTAELHELAELLERDPEPGRHLDDLCLSAARNREENLLL